MARVAVRAGAFPSWSGTASVSAGWGLANRAPARGLNSYVARQARFKSISEEEKEALWQEMMERRRRIEAFDGKGAPPINRENRRDDISFVQVILSQRAFAKGDKP